MSKGQRPCRCLVSWNTVADEADAILFQREITAMKFNSRIENIGNFRPQMATTNLKLMLFQIEAGWRKHLSRLLLLLHLLLLLSSTCTCTCLSWNCRRSFLCRRRCRRCCFFCGHFPSCRLKSTSLHIEISHCQGQYTVLNKGGRVGKCVEGGNITVAWRVKVGWWRGEFRAIFYCLQYFLDWEGGSGVIYFVILTNWCLTNKTNNFAKCLGSNISWSDRIWPWDEGGRVRQDDQMHFVNFTNIYWDLDKYSLLYFVDCNISWSDRV